MVQSIKKWVLKRSINTISNLSNKNLVRLINFAEKSFIHEDSIKAMAEGMKKLINDNHPTVQMAQGILKKLSKNCRDKFVENFFINAGIIGHEKQRKMAKKLGFGLPFLFVISPSAKCNLECVGCYASEYKMEEGLPYEEVDRVLKEAKELGIYFITISGGEPFMWPHLFRMLEDHNDMYFQIYTNGTLITKEVVKKLAKVGNALPAISIEGFEEETEKRRGPGMYQKVMDAMDNLKEAGVPFGFSATPTRLNSEILMSDKFIDKMIEKGAMIGWYFQYAPVGRNPDTSLMSTPEQRNKLRQRVLEFRDTRPIFIGDFWNDGPFVGGCMAGARPGGYFHINCNGDVEPCVFCQFSVDNIKGKKLIDVIQSPFFKAIREAQPYCDNKNLLTPCAVIDNPQALRDAVEKYGAKPSYNASYETVRNPEICASLDQYSKEYHELTDPIWEKEYAGKWKHWKDNKDYQEIEAKQK
ncbi:MAG: radical SAM protein [Candidatus Buchananbacteria bacterium]